MADAIFQPVVLNVTGKAGDRVRWTISVTDDDGDPVDWSSYVFAAQLRVNPWDAATVGAIAVDDTGKAGGILVLTVLPADTSTMLSPAMARSSLSWVWDMQRTKISDATDVRTTHGGAFTLTMDVTR